MDALEQYLLQEGQQKYSESCNLSDIEAKNDPETEPFKSKYKARELLQDLKSTFESYQNEDPQNEKLCFLVAGMDLKLGINFVETEEISTGETQLEKVIDRLKEHRLNKQATNILQNALNQMGVIWAGRRQPQKALLYLQDAEQLYKDYQSSVGGGPMILEDLINIVSEEDGSAEHKRVENFESTYTHTLYYLAQVYAKLEENQKSAEYCQVTLSRQLTTKKYEPIDWALNAATLSQYYLTQNKFPMARHCLASASVIIQEAGDPDPNLQPSDDETQDEADKREKIPRSRADISRCWSKYGIAFLEASREKLFQEVENMDDGEPSHNNDKSNGNGTELKETSEEKGTEAKKESEERQDTEDDQADKKSPFFFDLEVTTFEDQITAQFVNDFEQARPVFLCVQKWLNEAKEFYKLDGHCSDHVEIVQDHSRLFKVLAFFEFDFERQCKMHKRRIDMLSALLQQLNPQYYLLICRQLMYEIAETYSQMLDLKLAIMEESGAPSAHNVRKINLLAEQSIKQFKAYLDTLRDAKKEMPEKFCEDDERPALVAYFCLGRLYSKFMETDTQKRLLNMKNSLDHYKFLVDYCKKNPQAYPKIKHEKDVCEEMVTLLPLKMEKVRLESN